MNDKVWIEERAPYVYTGSTLNGIPLERGERYQWPPGREAALREAGFEERLDASIRIGVRPLQGAELGALRSTGPEFSRYVGEAIERKNAEDLAAYGMTTAQIRSQANREGYYESPAHVAWSEAAEARTGGKLTAVWWRGFDPYGGTNGNGPNILPSGSYPASPSKIGMAHDTDWSLGRHFQAGPLRELYGVGFDAETRGAFGVTPNNPINRREDIYTNGHPDWDVRYVPGRNRRAELPEGGDAAAVASGITHDGLYAAAREGVTQLHSSRPGLVDPATTERTAAALVAESRQQGLSRIDAVTASTDGQRLFAVQGAIDDPSHLRASVLTVPAAAQTLEASERLARQAPTEVVDVAQAETRQRALS